MVKKCKICGREFQERGGWCQPCIEKFEMWEKKVNSHAVEMGIKETNLGWEPITGFRLKCEEILSPRIVFHKSNWRDKEFCPFTIGAFIYDLGEVIDKDIFLTREYVIETEEVRK